MAKLNTKSKAVADQIRADMRKEGIKGRVTGTGYARGMDLLQIRVADDHVQAVKAIVGRVAGQTPIHRLFFAPTVQIYVDGGR